MALTSEEETALIDRAKRGDPGAARAFMEALQPILLWTILRHFSHLEEGHGPILEDAEATAARWLSEGEAGTHVRRDQSLALLAWRLLAQEGKTWTRARSAERKALAAVRAEAGYAGRTPPGVTRQRDAFSTFDPRRVDEGWEYAAQDALKAIEGLGEPHRSTLIAEATRALEGGASLAERLGLSAVATRQRLSRARRELARSLDTQAIRGYRAAKTADTEGEGGGDV